MAKVIRFSKAGDPSVLETVDEQVAAPGQGEVQIEVHAIGLNRAEAMFRRGQYLEDPQFPATLGYEASGVITAVGPDVKHFAVGDKVSTVPGFSRTTMAPTVS